MDNLEQDAEQAMGGGGGGNMGGMGGGGGNQQQGGGSSGMDKEVNSGEFSSLFSLLLGVGMVLGEKIDD